MYEIKQSTTPIVPVRFLDVSGNPVPGILSGTVTATVEKSDGTTQTVTVNGSTFLEVTSGAFANQGVYDLTLSGANTNTVGVLRYSVFTTVPVATRAYIGVINVVAKLASDVTSLIGTPPGGFTTVFGVMGTPINGSLALDIAAGAGGGGGPSLPEVGTFKVGSTPKIIVRLVDSQGAPVLGKTAVNITASSADPAGTVAAIAGFTFVELTTGTFASQGYYVMGATIPTSSVGTWTVDIACAGAQNWTAQYLVSTYLWDDIKTDTTLIRKVQTNRWKIFVSGPNANKLIVYDDDATTPLLTFNLKDSTGAATFVNPFERAP